MGFFERGMVERPGREAGPEVAFVEGGERMVFSVVVKDPVRDERKVACRQIDLCRIQSTGRGCGSQKGLFRSWRVDNGGDAIGSS